jgi:hypothetical protein
VTRNALFRLASGATPAKRQNAPRALAPGSRADIGHEKVRQNERAGNSEFGFEVMPLGRAANALAHAARHEAADEDLVVNP